MKLKFRKDKDVVETETVETANTELTHPVEENNKPSQTVEEKETAKTEVADKKEEKEEQKEQELQEEQTKTQRFFKKAFSYECISLSLAVLSIFFSFFTAFLPLATYSLQTLSASTAFFFLAFGCAFAGLTIEVVKMIKGGYKINYILLIVIVALVISVVVAPMTMNMNVAY